MAETKRNRNVQTLKTRGGFRISRNPLVQISAAERHDVPDGVRLPREYGARFLFAIARDPRTIFASWNVDWLALFEKVAPRDRQVHLRLHPADGLEEKTVAVEPLAAMHYLTTSGRHTAYSVEIGYYQPADVWHSVATSQEVAMPPSAMAETVDLDLATIPLHVGFQQLLNLFGSTNNDGLARVISQFQRGAFSITQPGQLSARQQQILRKLSSLSQLSAARRAFEQTNSSTLAERTGLGWRTSSPFRWLHAKSASFDS